MAETDRERWDARHATTGAGEPVPPSALDGGLDLLPSGGRALDLACGRGTVAVWLAEHGFVVDAVDVSGAGLAAGRALAAATATTERITWIEADLGDGLPSECERPYELVVCQRFRAPPLYPVLAEVLAPGGLLVVTVLSEVGDSGGRFRAAPGELATAFANLAVLAHHEAAGEAALVARAR